MLIGCGCRCETQSISQVPSGSLHSSGFGASELASASVPGGPVGFCGTCGNLPAEWAVTFGADWFTYQYPARDHDCRAGLTGTFVLRPYGAASITPAMLVVMTNLLMRDRICTVWQSDEQAQFVQRLNANGTANPGCRNPIERPIARVELVSAAPLGTSSSDVSSPTVFILAIWWLQVAQFNPESQWGQLWGWTVPDRIVNNNYVPTNCVRCFGADVAQPWGFNAAYGLNYAKVSEWSTIPVCPN